IDDMNPEVFGYLMDRLFDDGALDVFWIPIFMKKNRPGTMIQVICAKNKREAMIHRILSETSTLGVRYYDAQRYMLERDYMDMETSYGLITMKRVREPDGNFRLVPEYEVCKKIALDKNIPLKVVYEKILNDCAGKKFV
ncbi:MAG: LarC family nickel insertion protein, partial [Desulfobacterales bacterium]|nr:LarC family nickel insertion protein [Desulfobacterales bacterium]